MLRSLLINSLHAGLFFFMILYSVFCMSSKQPFQKLFKEYHPSVKQFGPRSGPTKRVGPGLGPNYLQTALVCKELKKSRACPPLAEQVGQYTSW